MDVTQAASPTTTTTTTTTTETVMNNPVDQFVQWSRDRGMNWTAVEPRAFPGMGIGIAPTRNLSTEPGARIMQIPLSIIINAVTVKNASDLLDAAIQTLSSLNQPLQLAGANLPFEAQDIYGLALFLATERRRGAASLWHPWLQLLSNMPGMPLVWPEEAYEEIRGPPRMHLDVWNGIVDHDFRVLSEAMEVQEEKDTWPSLLEFKWAVATAIGHRWSIPELAPCSKTLCFVPGLSFFNVNDVAIDERSALRLVPDKLGHKLNVFLGETSLRGDQVFDHFKNSDTLSMFVNHGIVVADGDCYIAPATAFKVMEQDWSAFPSHETEGLRTAAATSNNNVEVFDLATLTSASPLIHAACVTNSDSSAKAQTMLLSMLNAISGLYGTSLGHDLNLLNGIETLQREEKYDAEVLALMLKAVRMRGHEMRCLEHLKTQLTENTLSTTLCDRSVVNSNPQEEEGEHCFSLDLR
jgi:hypothetical protein